MEAINQQSINHNRRRCRLAPLRTLLSAERRAVNEMLQVPPPILERAVVVYLLSHSKRGESAIKDGVAGLFSAGARVKASHVDHSVLLVSVQIGLRLINAPIWGNLSIRPIAFSSLKLSIKHLVALYTALRHLISRIKHRTPFR